MFNVKIYPITSNGVETIVKRILLQNVLAQLAVPGIIMSGN